ENPLAPPQRVDLGGVEEGDSDLERTVDNSRRLPASVPSTVTPLPATELPRPKTDPGDRRYEIGLQVPHRPTVADQTRNARARRRLPPVVNRATAELATTARARSRDVSPRGVPADPAPSARGASRS